MSTRPAPPDIPAGLPAPGMNWALFLDVDGTLIDIAETPGAVFVPDHLAPLLDRVRDRLGGALALVSGRGLAALDRIAAPGAAAGLHGVERRRADGRVIVDDRHQAALARVRSRLNGHLPPGVQVEDKGLGIALHFRTAAQQAQAVLRLARDSLAGHDGDLTLMPGKMVVEIKSVRANKGRAIAAFMAEPPFMGRQPVFVGDDRTDEDGFQVVNRLGGLSIRVGQDRQPTRAHYRCNRVADVLDWLKQIQAGCPG